jgi:hypothetical protein
MKGFGCIVTGFNKLNAFSFAADGEGGLQACISNSMPQIYKYMPTRQSQDILEELLLDQ